MIYTVFDIETDGLLDVMTKLHVFSYKVFNGNKLILKGSTTDPKVISKVIEDTEFLVGHNIIRFDIPALKKLFGIEVPLKKCIDTLGLSWAIFPYEIVNGKFQNRKKHGLEAWGEVFGVPKPKVEDWSNLTYEEYRHRCEEDVEINTKLFHSIWKYLKVIFNNLREEIIRYIRYLGFKLDCAREQEELTCKIDIESAHKHYEDVILQSGARLQSLEDCMPEVPKYQIKKKPAKMYKADGSLSAIGEKWLKFCEEEGLDPESTEEAKYIKNYETANANSPEQVKKWLFSLGWEPTILEETTNTKGEVYEVPKISDKDGNICRSILSLKKTYPELEHLEGLGILKHRKGVFKSFINNTDPFTNTTIASVEGFTNTLRFTHRKPIANLPKVSKPWGKEIRGLIVTPDENHILCGSDMSSLEDTTKQHYMYYFDPEYVKAMRVPGFDPHMDIAVFAGLLKEEQVEDYKRIKKLLDKKEEVSAEEKKVYVFYTDTRGDAKVINFSAVYGAGPAKIAKTLGCTLEFAKVLHTAYWGRNKAVKQVANAVTTKVVEVPDYEILKVPQYQMWLLNPVSNFYYTLRNQKDIFSTLNQGTGVYCFDTWLSKVRRKGIKIMLQYHDEIGFPLLKEDEEKVKQALLDAIEETNKQIVLNVPLGISIDFGINYSEIH